MTKQGWSPLATSTDKDCSALKARRRALTHVVIHCTGNSFKRSHETFQPSVISPHYMIKEDGSILQYVSETLRANHAGMQEHCKTVYTNGTWRKLKRHSKWAEKAHFNNKGGAWSKEKLEKTWFCSLDSGEDWPVYAPMEAAFKKRMGTSPTKPCEACGGIVHSPTLPYHFEHSSLVNDYSIGIEIVHCGQAYLDAQYAALIRLLQDICGRNGIPYDKWHLIGHEDTNPVERWGWDPGITTTATRHLFDWNRVFEGGDWKLEDGPEPLIASPSFSLVRAPLGEPNRSPVALYYENEASYGGFFPFGLRSNLHSGIHLYPSSDAKEGEPAPVRSCAPGWIVAVRLAPENPETLKLVGNHVGFVLVRHEIREIKGPDEKGDPQALYSLYLHLSPPAWGSLDSDPYRDVPWLETLLRTKHGALVTASAEGEAPGKQYWATAALPAELKGPVTVYDVDGERTIDLTGPEGAVLALARDQPADPAQALAALEEGCVVTFAAPYLQVRAGERLGYVQAVEGAEIPSSFLHWEMLAPENAGISELLRLAQETLDLDGEFFPTITDDGNDNVWSSIELNEKLKGQLPQSDQDAIGDDPLFLGTAYEQRILKLLHDKAPLSFADHSTDDATWAGNGSAPATEGDKELLAEYPECRAALTYPLVLEITNHEGLLDPSAQDVRFKVTFDPKDLPEGEVKITDAGESWTVTLQVPAAARRIFLHSEGDLLLETQVIDLEQGKEFHKRGIESLVGHRWRNACVRHVSGWSFEAMEASLEAHKHSVEPTAYGPLAWWALGTDPSAATPPREQPWREVPILGNDDQEASIFGADGLLPDATGLVDNLHPVTGAWLLNVLAELGKISIVEQFTPFAGSGECDPLEAVHWGWATSKADPLVLGDSVTAMALTRGFPNGTAGTPSGCAALTAKDANGRTLPVGTLPYADGVAATDLAMPVWGTWTLELEGGTGDGGPLPKSVEVAKPALKGSHDPESKKGVVTWPIEFSDHQPSSLQGWVLFKHWTCDRDAEPEGDGTVSSFALDVEATPAGCKDPYCKLSLAESGQFVTGASTEDDPIPDADCVNKFKHYKKALADGQAFKVSVDLARIVQKIRADFGARQKKAKRKGYVNLRNLAADGMSIEVHCYYDNHTAKDFANLKAAGAAHAAHCEDVGDDGVKITVDPPGGAGVSRISFSPAKALQRLLEATPPGEGQVLRVAYGFVAPNGGRAAALGGALSDTFDPTRGEASDDADEVVEVDMQAVRSTCGDDGLIEVWSLPLVALSELKFTGEVVKEVKSTSITLKASFSEGATSGDFASARPRFVWTDAAGKQREFGKPVTGTTTLSGTLNLESLAKLSGKHVTIQATLTADTIIFAGQEASVPPLDIELPTRPHFENLEIKFDDDADVPCVEIVAESCCCGTNRALGLKVYKNDEETPLETSCRFKKPYATYRGFTDSRGKVVATITRKVFDRQFAPGDCAKFEFYRPYSDGKVYGHSMEATSVEETVPEESDEQTTGGGQ